MQSKETFTIKELAELFGMSRQAISKHISKMDATYIAKNERGYTILLHSGVLQLARNLGNQKLLERLLPTSNKKEENTDLPTYSVVEIKLLERLHVQLEKENQFLQEQLQKKSEEMEQMQKILDQQQQLTHQANNQIEKLQNQLALSAPADEEKTTFSKTVEAEKALTAETKKWYQFWK